jgi:hypothetical protein
MGEKRGVTYKPEHEVLDGAVRRALGENARGDGEGS